MNADQQRSSVDIILRSYQRAIQKHIQYHHGAGEQTFQGLKSAGNPTNNKAAPDIVQRRGSGDRAAGTSCRDTQQPTCGGQQADRHVQCTVNQEQYGHVPQHGSCGADKGPVAAEAVPTNGSRFEACPALQDSDRPSKAGTGAQPMQPHWPWWLSYPPPPPPPPLPPFLCPPFRLLPAEDAQGHYGMW
ncbi:g7945 [Coccomyxa elongata]